MAFPGLNQHQGLASETDVLHELDYLLRVRDQDPSHPGHAHVVKLFDHFHFDGPNGKHLCLVTELLGESVASLAYKYGELCLPPRFAKQIMHQVLLGLDYLHHSCNIIHTGTRKSS